MTATLERWWTPAAKVPLELLLTPGADPQKDFGQAFLALHRAGAEACELVAKTAVADETVLIAALAETRLIVAPQALVSISKGVESPQYAGLLVRDVLDDAEASALALYRTCLAKNIPPPVAAQRVGMVFGVPGRELGKYAAVASNPVSKDIAVADAADRALFSYVAKLVEAEFSQPKELVSKAPGPQRAERSDYLDEHNVTNGPDGRFVTEGEEHGRLADPARRTMPGRVKPLSVGPKRLGQRTARQARQPRMSREQLAQSQPKAEVNVLVTHVHSPTTSPARKLSPIQQEKARVQLTSTARQVQALIERHKANIEDPEPGPKPFGLGDAPDPLMERDDPNRRLHDYLNQSVGFVMPSSRFSVLSGAMADGDTPMERLILTGALTEFAGEPEKFHVTDDNGDVVVHQDHQFQVNQAAVLAHHETEGQQELWVKALPSGITRGMSAFAAEKLIRDETADLIREYAVENGVSLPVMREQGYVQPIANYEDPEQIILVYAPPPEDLPIGKRPTPNLTEVVIPESIARGHDQGHGRHTSYELDKNQGLTIADRSVFYDTTLGVVRTRVTMGAVDQAKIDRARDRIERDRDPRTRPPDGVLKAMTARQFEDHFEQGDIERGEDGRFVAQPAGRVIPGRVKLARTGRVARNSRQARAPRESREQQAERKASVHGQRVSVTGPKAQVHGKTDVRQSSVDQLHEAVNVTRSRSEVDPQGDPVGDALPVLSLPDGFKYSVVDAEAMHAMAADDGWPNPDLAQEPWALGWRAHHEIRNPGRISADDAEKDLLTSQLPESKRFDLEDDMPRGKIRPLAQQSIRSENDLWKLEAQIHKEMDTSEGAKVLTAHFYNTGGGDVVGEMIVELEVHEDKKPSQYLIRWDPKVNNDSDVQLVPEGSYHMLSKPLVRNWLETAYKRALHSGSNTAFLHNPKVTVFRAEEQP